MPRRYYSSTAVETTLTSNVSNSATTLPVASTSGFPPQTPFTLILDEGTINEEIVTVTGVATLNLTVTRGEDGTAAVSHSNGATVKHGVSARDFDEANDFINNPPSGVKFQTSAPTSPQDGEVWIDSDSDVATLDPSTYVSKTLLDAKGDLIVASGADTPARLAVGTNGHVLTADSTAGSGVKWAAVAGGGFDLIATATPSAAVSVQFTSIPTDYKILMIAFKVLMSATSQWYGMRLNNVSSASSHMSQGFFINNGGAVTQTTQSGTLFGASSEGPVGPASTSVEVTKGTIIIKNANDATRAKLVEWQGVGFQAGAYVPNWAQAEFTGTDPVTQIDFVRSSTQTITGVFYLYGAK